MPSDKCIPKLNNKKKNYISHFTLGFYLVLGTCPKEISKGRHYPSGK